MGVGLLIYKDPQPVPDHVYAKRSASGTLGLHFDSFQTNDIGEYQCEYTSVGRRPTTLTINLSETQYIIHDCFDA